MMTKAKTVRRQDFADALSAATPGLDPRNARRLVDAVVAQLITELRAAGDVIVPRAWTLHGEAETRPPLF